MVVTISTLIGTSSQVIKICFDITTYFRKISNVDATIAVLLKEINDLSAVLSNIDQSVRDFGNARVAVPNGERHWEDLVLALSDCQETLETLFGFIKRHKTVTLRGFLGRAMDQVTLDWNSDDINLLQRQIASCRQTLEISLQMIVVYLFRHTAFLILALPSRITIIN